MADFTHPGTVSISCPKALNDVLQKEVEALGFSPIRVRDTGLDIAATLNDCIKLNFHLRTAHRVHYLLGEKVCDTPDKLHTWLKSLPWEEWIHTDGYVTVTSRVDHPRISNTQFANMRVKDAIVDRMRFKTGQRPDSGPGLDKSVVFLYWSNRIARIYVDTSGESLSRRGYRTETSEAPMQESLASGIVQSTIWEPGMHFINPMCGSGTIAIEAAMIALNRAPASLRNNFGFMHIPGFDEGIYRAIRNDARRSAAKEYSSKIIASDSNPAAIRSAQKNAQTAGVDHIIEFEVCDVADTPLPDGNGVVVMNPPYGERLGSEEDLIPLYKSLGDFMKQKCSGKTGYIFTGNLNLAKKIGLRSGRRIEFYNSTIECRLLEFEIY